MILPIKPVGRLQCRRSGFSLRAALAALFVSLIAAASARADVAEPAKPFDLPAGDAVGTLKQFTAQSGVQLVYLVDTVRGTTTGPVKGLMTPREALTVMLTGTNLEVVEDTRSGALTIRQRDRPKTSSTSPGSSDDEIVKLNPFEVSATSYNGYAASETVSGSKVAARLIDSIETINVVTQDMINDIGYQDPNDFLPASTAAVSNYAISSPNQGVYIRGFRAQNWSVDGATEASFAQLDNFNFESFEIVKGPSALLFGPFGAFGGYVNMIPKYAGEDGELNQLQLTVGTSDYTSELLDVGGATLGGDVDGRLVAGEYDDHRAGKPGDYDHNHTLAPSVTLNISKSSKLKFRVDIESSHIRNSEDAENAQGVVLQNYTDDGPDNIQPNLGTEDRSVITQTVFTSQLSDTWSMKLDFMTEAELYHTNQVLLVQDAATGLTTTDQYPQATYQYDELNETISFHSWYGGAVTNWKVPDFGHGFSNDLTLSGDLYSYLDDYIFYANSATTTMYPQYNVPPYTTFDPSDPNYASVANMSLLVPQQVEPYAVEWLGGVDVLDTFGLFDKKLQIVLGTRYNYDSRYSYNTTRTTPTAPLAGTPSTDVIEELWLKRYGLVYQPIPQMSFYYGHDEGYISVGVGYTYAGALIQPQSGKEDEVGMKTDLFKALGGQWSSQIAYFQLHVTNINIADPQHFGYYLEEAAEQNYGFDSQLTYQNDKLSGTVGFYNADGPYNPITNVRVPYSPKETFVSWAKYNITPAIAFGGGWRYQGDSLDGFSNNTLAGYDTLSLFATYTKKLPKGKIIWRLGMSNVTNATAAYMEVTPERIFTEAGRETKLTMTYIW